MLKQENAEIPHRELIVKGVPLAFCFSCCPRYRLKDDALPAPKVIAKKHFKKANPKRKVEWAFFE